MTAFLLTKPHFWFALLVLIGGVWLWLDWRRVARAQASFRREQLRASAVFEQANVVRFPPQLRVVEDWRVEGVPVAPRDGGRGEFLPRDGGEAA